MSDGEGDEHTQHPTNARCAVVKATDSGTLYQPFSQYRGANSIEHRHNEMSAGYVPVAFTRSV